MYIFDRHKLCFLLKTFFTASVPAPVITWTLVLVCWLTKIYYDWSRWRLSTWYILFHKSKTPTCSMNIRVVCSIAMVLGWDYNLTGSSCKTANAMILSCVCSCCIASTVDIVDAAQILSTWKTLVQRQVHGMSFDLYDNDSNYNDSTWLNDMYGPGCMMSTAIER